MRDLRSWLAERNLSALYDRFATQDVDFEMLSSLTDADFVELGLTLGERKNLKRALLDASDPSTSVQHDERRRVTLLFLDMVGFSALSRSCDPEQLRELALCFHAAVERAVTEHGGRVVQRMGDGALCVFGWPSAIEDSAIAATAAGLAGIAATEQLSMNAVSIEARGGAATGLVVRSSDQEVFFGETPNLAARLQALAPPGGLMIAAETRALVAGAFSCEETSVSNVKGFDDLTRVFRVLARADVVTRFEARDARPAQLLVGRDAEFSRLQSIAKAALAGHGTTVVIEGEAGIGKSCLAEALIASVEVQAPEADVVRLQCVPERTSSPFYAVRRALARLAGLDRDDDRETVLAKLRVNLAIARADVVVDLVVRDSAQSPSPSAETARRTRRRLLTELGGEFVARAKRRPLIFLVEDTHWVDASTQALIEALAEQIDSVSLLVITTTRPNPRRPMRFARSERFLLSRLSRGASLEIARRVATGSVLSERDLEEIQGRGEGVPLFIEELTKALASGAPLPRPVGGPKAAPASLHDFLMSRLDGDPAAKRAAQIAACIGRRFSLELLAHSKNATLEAATTAVTLLVERGLVRKEGDAYVFTHALLRDAAYESLVREHRVSVHRRVLDALAAHSATDPDVLALHAEGADDIAAAIGHRRTAARHALRRAAYQEAAEHLDAADTLLAAGRNAHVASELAADRVSLRLRLAAGSAFAWIAAEGYMSPSASAAVLRVKPLIDAGLGGLDRFAAAYAAWTLRLAVGPHEKALGYIERLRDAPEAGENGSQRFFVEAFSGYSMLALGRLGDAERRLETARTLYDPEAHERGADRIGHSPGRDLIYRLALLRMLQNRLDLSEALVKDVTGGVSEVEAHASAQLLMKLGLIALLTADWARLRSYVSRLDDLLNRVDLSIARIVADGYRFAIDVAEGHASALAALDKANDAYEQEVMLFLAPPRRIVQAELALRVGAISAAEAACARASRLIERTGERLAEAEAERVHGAIAVARGDLVEARRRNLTAASIARRQGAGLWGRRANLALGAI